MLRSRRSCFSLSPNVIDAPSLSSTDCNGCPLQYKSRSGFREFRKKWTSITTRVPLQSTSQRSLARKDAHHDSRPVPNAQQPATASDAATPAVETQAKAEGGLT